MEHNSVATSFMPSLWNGTPRVQLSPTLTAETRQSRSEIWAPPSSELQDTWPLDRQQGWVDDLRDLVWERRGDELQQRQTIVERVVGR
jgi:hypothetical protein